MVTQISDAVPRGEGEVVLLSVSDHHLIAHHKVLARRYVPWQQRFRYWLRGKRVPVEYEEVLNPLDDFPVAHEEMFSVWLDAITEEYRAAAMVVLVINGDWADFISVPNADGKGHISPYEDDAVVIAKQVFAGNPIYMDALRRFVARERCYLVFTPGNHDPQLHWPGVQRALIHSIAGDDAVRQSRVLCVDYREGSCFKIGEVLFEHGDKADPINAPLDPIILTERFGLPVDPPKLRVPVGSLVAVEVTNKIKKRNAAIGRELEPWRIWWYYAIFDFIGALHFNWTFDTFMLVLLGVAITQRTLRDFFRTFYQLVTTTLIAHKDQEYGRRRLLETGARVIVMGHTHNALYKTFEDGTGTYINTGTWSLLTRYVWPVFLRTWRRFTWLEYLGRLVGHFVATQEQLVLTLLLLVLLGFVLLHLTFVGAVVYVIILVMLVIGRLVAVKPYLHRWVKPTFAKITYQLSDPRGTLAASLCIVDVENPRVYRQCV